MKQLSVAAKLTLGTLAAVALISYLAVVDLGMNAGLIHYGVSVGHVDIGRMTNSEAMEAIEVAGAEMSAEPIVFGGGGLPLYSWLPAELGWQPRASLMVERASSVGRRNSLTTSISERVRSYLGGLTVRWERPKGWRVKGVIADVVVGAAARNIEVDTEKLERRIRRAVRSWPREEVYEIPTM
jgi:hypothetical protein